MLASHVLLKTRVVIFMLCISQLISAHTNKDWWELKPIVKGFRHLIWSYLMWQLIQIPKNKHLLSTPLIAWTSSWGLCPCCSPNLITLPLGNTILLLLPSSISCIYFYGDCLMCDRHKMPLCCNLWNIDKICLLYNAIPESELVANVHLYLPCEERKERKN